MSAVVVIAVIITTIIVIVVITMMLVIIGAVFTLELLSVIAFACTVELFLTPLSLFCCCGCCGCCDCFIVCCGCW